MFAQRRAEWIHASTIHLLFFDTAAILQWAHPIVLLRIASCWSASYDARQLSTFDCHRCVRTRASRHCKSHQVLFKTPFQAVLHSLPSQVPNSPCSRLLEGTTEPTAFCFLSLLPTGCAAQRSGGTVQGVDGEPRRYLGRFGSREPPYRRNQHPRGYQGGHDGQSVCCRAKHCVLLVR